MFDKFLNRSGAVTKPQPSKDDLVLTVQLDHDDDDEASTPGTATLATTPAAVSQPGAVAPAGLQAQLNALSGQVKQAQQQTQQQNTNAAQSVYSALKVIVNQHGEVFLRAQRGQRLDCLPIESTDAIEHIMLELKDRANVTVSKDTILRELGPIKARAKRTGKVTPTFIRCAHIKGAYVVDLGDEDGTAVFIDAAGVDIRPQSEVVFRRDDAYGSLPKPLFPGSTQEAWDFLTAWVEDQGTEGVLIPLHVVTMIEYLRPETAHPILAFIGAAGSGKSGSSKRTARCIDPSKSGKLADVKLTTEDMAASAQGSYLQSSDNKSRLDADTQDLCCKVSTGAVAISRKYYAQGESVRLPLHNPLILTFVNLGISATDLIDRTLVINVRPPKAYKNEAELEAEFLGDQPRVTGAMYSLLSAGLTKLPEVIGQRQWKHRLVDFCQLGEAVMQAAGHEIGAFLKAFDEYRAKNATEVASGDKFIIELIRVLGQIVKGAPVGDKFPPWRQWGEAKGCGYAAIETPSGNYLAAIKAKVLLDKLHKDLQGSIPENERQLAGAMNRVQPLLRSLNVEASRKDAPGKRVIWEFCFPKGVVDA